MARLVTQQKHDGWTGNNTSYYIELHLCIEADGRVAVAPVEGPAANDVGARSK